MKDTDGESKKYIFGEKKKKKLGIQLRVESMQNLMLVTSYH